MDVDSRTASIRTEIRTCVGAVACGLDQATARPLTTEENVAMPLELNNLKSRVALRMTRGLRDEVGLEGLYGRFPANLSGGR